MLPFFRKNYKIFVWIIVLSFVGWGLGSIAMVQNKAQLYAGKVGKEPISQKEFLTTFRFYEVLSQALQTPAPQEAKEKTKTLETTPQSPVVNADITTASGKVETVKPEETAKQEPEQTPPPASFDEIKSMAWQAIILSREAKKMDIQVTDDEVANAIRGEFSNPSNGSFDMRFYDTWVRNQFKGEPREFEEAYRKHIAIQKIRSKVLEGIPEKEQTQKWMAWLLPIISKAELKDYNPQS